MYDFLLFAFLMFLTMFILALVSMRYVYTEFQEDKKTEDKTGDIITNLIHEFERVTKIKNIKTDATKILRPTHFLFLNMLLSLT